MPDQSNDQVRLPLWTRMLLGACAGVVLPIVALVQVQALNPRAVLLALFLGPIFGASFVYFLDRYHVGGTAPGKPIRFSLAGAMAGGAAAALAYDFGMLSATWHVAVGIGAGFVPESLQILDAGDHLVVRRRGQEFMVPWDEIADVEESHHRFGEFITIHFSRRGPIGASVTFTPSFRFSWFHYQPSPVATHLRARIAASLGGPSAAGATWSDIEDS